MLDTTEHMLLLLQQAKIKSKQPVDASFLPLSLTLAALLRQLPAGLAPPVDGVSFLQLDRLPQENLERKLASMLLDDPLLAFSFVCALVKYTKLTRELLGICHDHLINRKTTVEATQSIVQAVVQALPPLTDVEEEEENEEEEEEKRTAEGKKEPSTLVKKLVKETKSPALTEQAVATDPAGIMRRAVGRDVGDGSTVLQIMKKFPTDVRIQSHGVRALKGVIRSMDQAADTESEQLGNQKSDSSSRLIIQTVIDKMKQFPQTLTLQRDGLLCLAEIANQADEHIPIITSSGGISSLIDAMVALPDDVPANMAGLSVLAHPKISDEAVVRVNPESRRLVLSAMERFPLNEQVQGLSCLALANLSLRQDASMLEIVSKGGLEIVVDSMKRFSSTALVQAAGCWFIAITSGKTDEMKTACLDAGALPVCEKARLRFPNDAKVQQHAVQAIQTMEVIEGESMPDTCSVQ